MEMRFSPKTGLRLGAAVPCYRIYGDRQVATAYRLADWADHWRVADSKPRERWRQLVQLVTGSRFDPLAHRLRRGVPHCWAAGAAGV